MTPGPFPALIDDALGRVVDRGDGFYDIVLERRIRKPVEKVWAALTVPERVADWFTTVEIDPRLAGHYRLRFEGGNGDMDGEIVGFDPPRLLAHTWPHETHPDSVVRYELEPDGEGCRLTLTQTALSRVGLNALAGWHAFLEALPGAADAIRTPWTWAREKEIGERYRAVLPA
ncbi:MAG: SRPBCC family protein [Phenylobacterium sp.]